MISTAFVLYVNMSIPKASFKTMQECTALKSVVEKRISAHYNPVALLQQIPTISCIKVVEKKPVKKPIKKPVVKKDAKKINFKDKKK